MTRTTATTSKTETARLYGLYNRFRDHKPKSEVWILFSRKIRFDIRDITSATQDDEQLAKDCVAKLLASGFIIEDGKHKQRKTPTYRRVVKRSGRAAVAWKEEKLF